MPKKVIYALGFFDGIHLAHAALLKACGKLANENACNTGIVTFTTHPDTLVLGKTPLLINTPADRKKLLTETFSTDCVLELPFDKTLMNMPWQDFIRLLIAKHNAAGFVCGADFRFGKGGEGTARSLQAFCQEKKLACCIVKEQTLDGIPISSSHIRKLLEQGAMEEAVRFLGHPHILTGTVVSGQGLGKTLGTPTANLSIPEGVVIPRLGVYACKATVDGQTYLAVTNVGTRPTVAGQAVTVEPWLLDFNGDLYGKELTLSFYAYLREERKFPSLENLQAEIRKNGEETRKLLEKS